jgi:hypothetical protein
VAEVEAETETCIRGGDGRYRRLAKAAKVVKGGRGRGMYRRWWHASEALECIGRAQRWMELMELIEMAVNTKCRRWSKWSELVRTCQNRMVLIWGYFCYM